MAGKKGRKKGRRSTGAQLGPSDGTASIAKKPAAAVPACKYHMSKATVQSILNHKREPFIIGSYFDSLDDEKKRLMLEAASEHEKIEDRYDVYQEEVCREFEAKGFVTLPDDYDERTAAVNVASNEIFRRLVAEFSLDE